MPTKRAPTKQAPVRRPSAPSSPAAARGEGGKGRARKITNKRKPTAAASKASRASPVRVAKRPKAKATAKASAKRRTVPTQRETLFDAYWLKNNAPPNWPKLPAKERMALALVLFDSQMRRNGAQFWITNGYSRDDSAEVGTQLAALGSVTSRKVAQIVVEIGEIELRSEKLEEEARLKPEDDDDSAFEELGERCCDLDDRYRKLGNKLMQEVEAWLLAR